MNVSPKSCSRNELLRLSLNRVKQIKVSSFNARGLLALYLYACKVTGPPQLVSCCDSLYFFYHCHEKAEISERDLIKKKKKLEIK